MTRDEMDFCGIVGEFTVDGRPLRETGFAVLELDLFTAEVYTLKLQLVTEISEERFTFPASELDKSVLERQLPIGLASDLTKHFDSPLAKLIRSSDAL